MNRKKTKNQPNEDSINLKNKNQQLLMWFDTEKTFYQIWSNNYDLHQQNCKCLQPENLNFKTKNNFKMDKSKTKQTLDPTTSCGLFSWRPGFTFYSYFCKNLARHDKSFLYTSPISPYSKRKLLIILKI